MVDSELISNWFKSEIAAKLRVFSKAKEKMYLTYNDAFERQDAIIPDSTFLILNWETGNPVDPGDQQLDIQTSALFVLTSVKGDDPKDVLAAQNGCKRIFFKQILPRMKAYMEADRNRTFFNYQPRITYQPEEKMIGKCSGYSFEIIWQASAYAAVNPDDEI